MRQTKPAVDNVIPIHKVLVKADVVAAHIGYKPATVVYLARKGKIPAKRIQNGVRTHWRFDLEEVLKALEK